MSDSFSFLAPLPPKALSSNSRLHWKAQIRPKKISRLEGELLAAHTIGTFRSILGKGSAPQVLLQVDAFPAKRGLLGDRCCPADPSNGVAVLKAFQDGLAKGWEIDDKGVQVVWIRKKRGQSTPAGGCLFITVSRWGE